MTVVMYQSQQHGRRGQELIQEKVRKWDRVNFTYGGNYSVNDRLFFIFSIKFPQCTDKNSKTNFSIAIFLACVLMYQKRQISLSVGYKTATQKTGDWEWL